MTYPAAAQQQGGSGAGGNASASAADAAAAAAAASDPNQFTLACSDSSLGAAGCRGLTWSFGPGLAGVQGAR